MRTDVVASALPSVLPLPDKQPILNRLSGSGSLLSELEAILRIVPNGATPEELRVLVVNENAAAKSSHASRPWAWGRVRLRYVLDPAVPEARAFLDGMQHTTSPSERALLAFLMFGRADRLFREVALECVSPFLREEGTTIDPETVEAAIRARIARGDGWTPRTLDTTRIHYLSAIKDFGLIRGTRPRRTVRPRPGHQTTLFACRLGRLEGLSDRQILGARWFQLLGLNEAEVVDLLHAAHREGVLTIRRQADVVELSFPDPVLATPRQEAPDAT